MISDIREALAAAVDTIEGLRCSPYLTDQVNPPQAMVARKVFLYDETFDAPALGHSTEMTFSVIVYAGRVSERTAQILLDDLADPESDVFLKTVIETDSDLLDLCDSVNVASSGELTLITVGVVDYLTTEFPVTILR